MNKTNDLWSVFSKDELPAWSEIMEWYNNYYKKDQIYKSDNPGEIDKYWKIPRKKVLFGLMCNQFNRMLFLDDFTEDLINLINSSGFSSIKDDYKATDVRFCVTNSELVSVGEKPDFYIYYMENPNGIPDPFKVERPHRCINKYSYDLSVFPAIRLKSPTRITKVYSPIFSDTPLYEAIIEYLMEPFKEYFGGKGIGWKNKNGELIENPSEDKPYYLGYDQGL